MNLMKKIFMDDCSTDINSPRFERDNLDELWTVFDLKNILTSGTCITKAERSTIDLTLTTKQSSFQTGVTT